MAKLVFEWHWDKAEANRRKHGVAFTEAVTVFGDSSSLLILDSAHSSPQEERWVLLGRSSERRLLVVSHCDRGERIRLISARPAMPKERQAYEKTRQRMGRS